MKKFFLISLGCLLILSCKSEAEKNEELARELENRSFQDNDLTADSKDREEAATDVEIHPISHATAVLTWGDTRIFLDPTGGAEAFENHKAPDFVLITDIHGDHMDPATLSGLALGSTPIVVPQAVKDELPEDLQEHLVVLDNGERHTENQISIEAIPMYNLREEAMQYHEKGRGNGYVLEKNGTRLYIAGDTEDIPEMRNLKDIDMALIPMNLPYTMPVENAAEAVVEFAPDQVIPYHYRGTNGFADVDRFKELVNQGNPEVEVVLLEWYPGEQN